MNKVIDHVSTDYTEIRCAGITGFPLLRTGITRRADGTYLVNNTYYDKDGYYVAHRSSTRIAHNIDELING